MPYYGRDAQGLGVRPPLQRPVPPRPDNRALPLGINPIGYTTPPAPQHPNSFANSPFMPNPQPVVPPAYVDPSARIAAEGGALLNQGLTQEQVQAELARRAALYGGRRLAQLRRVAPQLSPELRTMLMSGNNLDPAAAWRAISGAFSQFANQQGYQDPRMMLRLGANRASTY